MKYIIPGFVLATALVSSSAVFAPVGREIPPFTIVATGDVMLGRAVEKISLIRGFEYPFLYTKDIFSGADVVFSNLEGPVPSEHKKTPDYSFRFSFLPESIRAMKSAGVNVVTLANNHMVDFGEDGYGNTTKELQKQGVDFVGHPVRIGEGLTVGKTIQGREVRFVGLNDTYAPVSIEQVSEMVRNLKKDGAFVIVAVHWGEEYKNVSNKRQQTLGRALIDAGADAVVGHHPHVVQEIEIYKEKPIFYSLGNFVFDQYFSEETQAGLAVKIAIGDKKTAYELIPVDLHKSQPKRMSSDAEEKWLEELSLRSAKELRSDIIQGGFSLPR
jgi:poly-gamma-glutamate synthesis protein (capsule biosynthesis protein)